MKKDQTQQTDQQKQKKLIFEESKRRFLTRIGIGKLYWKTYTTDIPKIEDYIENIEQNIKSGKGLILTGGLGIGKTTLLSRIAQIAFFQGSFDGIWDQEKYIPMWWKCKFSIAFLSVSTLSNLFYNQNFEKIDKLKEIDLLLLDDFGREYKTDFTAANLEDFFEYRYGNQKATCVTTNLVAEQMQNDIKYSRIIDRFRDKKVYTVIQIAGESKRKGNNNG